MARTPTANRTPASDSPSTTGGPDAEPSTEMVALARQLTAVLNRPTPTAGGNAVDRSGDGAAADGAAAGDLGATISRAARIEAGRRARRLPLLGTTVTAATGYTAWGVCELAYAGAGPVGELVAAGGTAGLCAATLAVLRLTYRDRIPTVWRRRWWAAGAGAATWVNTAAVLGAGSWPMTAALALGAAAASRSWLTLHQVPRPHDQPPLPTPALPAPTVAELVEDSGTVLVRRWSERIARPGGVVPGSMLTDRVELPHAIRWTVQTIPGTTSFSSMFALRDRIASGLQVPAARVLLEPSETDESAAILTVITKDLLAAGIPYVGPRYHDGRIEVGPWADGSGMAEYIAVDRVGCRNGMASGEPGSGKSAFLEAVALGLKSSGEWVVWFGDGDPEGGSSPLLNELADWPEAGPARVLAQLEAIEAVLIVRGMVKSTLTADPDTGLPIPITDPTTQRPLREIRPCPAYPGLKWIIDELHRLSSDPWMKAQNFIPRLERVTRIGRKYGVTLLTGSQSLLAGDFGNSTPLRGYLAARNLFAFRNGNKTEKAVVSGLVISPGTLPAGGGYCYSAGSGRLAMTRVAWAADMARWIPGLPATDLDPDTLLAATPFLPDTPRDPATALAEQQARLAAWRALQGATPAITAAGTGPAPVRTMMPALSMGALSGLVVPGALTGDNVIALRPELRPEDEGPDLDALNNAQRAVYDALHDGAGPRSTGALAELTGFRLPAVSKALSALADLGLAAKIAHGIWAPTGPTTAAARPDDRTADQPDLDTDDQDDETQDQDRFRDGDRP